MVNAKCTDAIRLAMTIFAFHNDNRIENMNALLINLWIVNAPTYEGQKGETCDNDTKHFSLWCIRCDELMTTQKHKHKKSKTKTTEICKSQKKKKPNQIH